MEQLMLKGRISISRTTGGDESRPISITILDDAAWIELCEIRMTLAEFAEALTGHGQVECLIEHQPDSRIGKVREHKQERVFVPGESLYQKDAGALATVRAAVAPHEVDGWCGDISDAFNSHRRTYHAIGPSGQKGIWVNMSFRRWVDRVPATQPAADPPAEDTE